MMDEIWQNVNVKLPTLRRSAKGVSFSISKKSSLSNPRCESPGIFEKAILSPAAHHADRSPPGQKSQDSVTSISERAPLAAAGCWDF